MEEMQHIWVLTKSRLSSTKPELSCNSMSKKSWTQMAKIAIRTVWLSCEMIPTLLKCNSWPLRTWHFLGISLDQGFPSWGPQTFYLRGFAVKVKIKLLNIMARPIVWREHATKTKPRGALHCGKQGRCRLRELVVHYTSLLRIMVYNCNKMICYLYN